MGDSTMFPKNKTDALAFLYLQNQDLSKLTPSELLRKYEEVRKEISDASSRSGN